MVQECGQTNPVPFAHTQQHKFAHPHSQQHTPAPFFTVTHIQTSPFTTTQPHPRNHSQQSHSLTVLLCPTESYSHSFTFMTGHLTDFHSVLLSRIQPHPPTLVQVSSLSHSHSLIVIPLPHKHTVLHTHAQNHIHTQCHLHSSHSHVKPHKIPGSHLATLLHSCLVTFGLTHT